MISISSKSLPNTENTSATVIKVAKKYKGTLVKDNDVGIMISFPSIVIPTYGRVTPLLMTDDPYDGKWGIDFEDKNGEPCWGYSYSENGKALAKRVVEVTKGLKVPADSVSNIRDFLKEIGAI